MVACGAALPPPSVDPSPKQRAPAVTSATFTVGNEAPPSASATDTTAKSHTRTFHPPPPKGCNGFSSAKTTLVVPPTLKLGQKTAVAIRNIDDHSLCYLFQQGVDYAVCGAFAWQISLTDEAGRVFRPKVRTICLAIERQPAYWLAIEPGEEMTINLDLLRPWGAVSGSRAPVDVRAEPVLRKLRPGRYTLQVRGLGIEHAARVELSH